MIHFASNICLKLCRTFTPGFVTNLFGGTFLSHISSDIGRNSHLLVTLLVQPEHFKNADIDSCMNDPIALALKERLDLKLGEYVAVGEDEIFLVKDNKSYTAKFDLNKFYLPQPGEKPRVISLKFFEA